jgi:hypothetical protein
MVRKVIGRRFFTWDMYGLRRLPGGTMAAGGYMRITGA